MKIAITTGTFHPESGGPPTYLHRLGAELVARGHRVRLLTFGERGTHRYAHPVMRVSRAIPVPARLASYSLRALRLAAWSDVLFASDYGLPASLAAFATGRPFVLRVAGDFAWETSVRRGWVPPTTTVDAFQRMPKRGRVAMIAALQAAYVRRADRVIVPSGYLASLTAGWGASPERVRVVENAVDLEHFDLSLTTAAARLQLGLEGPLVLTIARLVPWKGIDHVLRALAALHGPDAPHLVHCGEGPDEPRLRSLVGELGLGGRVRFEGRVPRETIPLYLRAADVFVLYSGYEGMPHVVLEAMAARTPVIVSDRGGNPEVVRHRQTGLIIPYDQPEALIDAIGTTLSQPQPARSMAERARAEVGQRFGWSRVVAETLAVLEEAAARRLG